MISNYRYYSFKLKGTVPYIFFVFAVLVLGITAQRPHEVFLITTIAYATSGPANWLYRRQFAERSDVEINLSDNIKRIAIWFAELQECGKVG